MTVHTINDDGTVNQDHLVDEVNLHGIDVSHYRVCPERIKAYVSVLSYDDHQVIYGAGRTPWEAVLNVVVAVAVENELMYDIADYTDDGKRILLMDDDPEVVGSDLKPSEARDLLYRWTSSEEESLAREWIEQYATRTKEKPHAYDLFVSFEPTEMEYDPPTHTAFTEGIGGYYRDVSFHVLDGGRFTPSMFSDHDELTTLLGESFMKQHVERPWRT